MAGTYTVWVKAQQAWRTGTYKLRFIGAPTLGLGYAAHPTADYMHMSSRAGDPVSTVSGDFTHGNTDVSIPALGMPLEFSRSYHSGTQVERSVGRGWTHNWDMYLDIGTGLVTAYYPQGHGSVFTLVDGSYVAPVGVRDTLLKNLDNSFTLTTKLKVEYEFSATGKLTSIADRNGNTTTLSYDGSGYLASVTAPGGHELSFTVDGSGRITTVEDDLGRTVGFTYTGTDLTSVTDVMGETTTYTYGTYGMTSLTDANGHQQVAQIFDSAGRVVEQTDAEAGKNCYYYGTAPSYTSAGCPGVSPSPTSSQTVLVDPRGNKTTYEFDFLYRTTKITDALGGVTQYTYDSSNNLLTEKDPLNHTVWTYTYDESGNVLTKKNALNRTSTYTYNVFNEVLTATDPLSHTVTNTYDANGNLATVTDALSKTTTFDVNAAGLVEEITDPLANTTSFTYDAHGNRLTVTNGVAKTWTSAYDAGGRVLTVTDPNANVTTYTYNHSNQVLTVTNDLGEVTTYTYDDKGNKLTVEDANGKVTTYAYDDMDRLTSIEDAALETTTYAYDGNGNRTSVTNTRGKTTTYAYDALNRRTSVTDPLSEVTSYTYDAASRLTQRTDARGLLTKYFYDNADRLTSVEHRLANNTLVDTITYAYDNANRRTSMVDPAGTTTYAYDNADRLTSVTFPGSQVVSYLYDDAGNRTRITYPDTKQVNYGYDDANRLATVTDWLTNVTTYTYDDAGRLASLAYPNGVDTTYGYDDADRLLSLVNGNGSTFSSFAYTLDDVGNRTQVVANNGTTTFDYDDLYRLTEVTYPGPSTDTYTYDELGNRLTKDATSYTYDDGDRMTAAGGVSYTYDDNGNQTARGSDTFTWDHENRVTQSVVGGVTSSSVYYGNGVRRSHTVNGVTTTYTWDVNASLPVVLQDGTNTYVYGLDLISATNGAGDQVYFSHDGLGSVTDITDDVGVVTDTYEYDVFGAVSAHGGSSASPWKFTGEQHEGAAGDTGYYFLRARYYDVDLGRFISRDPIEFDQRYGYADGNPVLYTDPAGLAKVPHAPASMRERLVFSEADSGERSWIKVDCRSTSCVGGVGKPSKPYGYNALGDYLSSCTTSVLSRHRDCADSTKAGVKAVRPVVEPVVDAARDPQCYFPTGIVVAGAVGYFVYPPLAGAYLGAIAAASEAAVTGCLVR